MTPLRKAKMQVNALLSKQLVKGAEIHGDGTTVRVDVVTKKRLQVTVLRDSPYWEVIRRGAEVRLEARESDEGEITYLSDETYAPWFVIKLINGEPRFEVATP